MYVAVYPCEIGACLLCKLANNLIDQLALLQLFPHVTAGGIEREHGVVFKVENHGSIAIDDGTKVRSRSRHLDHPVETGFGGSGFMWW